MTHPGLRVPSMRALRVFEHVFEAGSSGFLKPPPSLRVREKTCAAQAAPRPLSLSFVDPPTHPPLPPIGHGTRIVLCLNDTPRSYGNRVCMIVMGHGALDEDRTHDPEQGQPCTDWARHSPDGSEGRHLTNPVTKSYRMDTPDQVQSPVEMKQPTDHDQTRSGGTGTCGGVPSREFPRVLSQHHSFFQPLLVSRHTGLPSFTNSRPIFFLRRLTMQPLLPAVVCIGSSSKTFGHRRNHVGRRSGMGFNNAAPFSVVAAICILTIFVRRRTIDRLSHNRATFSRSFSAMFTEVSWFRRFMNSMKP